MTAISDFYRRHRRLRQVLLIFFLIILLLIVIAATIFVVALFVFVRPKDPTVELANVKVNGLPPNLDDIPSLVLVDVNASADVTAVVYNPNLAAFNFSEGRCLLYYHGEQIGDGEVPPSEVLPKGREVVQMRIKVDANKAMSTRPEIIGEALRGHLELSTETTVEGHLVLLDYVKAKATGATSCRVTVSVPDWRVTRMDCNSTTRTHL